MQKTLAKTVPDALGCVDTERFPLRDPASSTYGQRVTEAREALECDGCCVLRGLIHSEALVALAKETSNLAPEAHFTSSCATVYGDTPDQQFAEGDPRRVEVQRDNGFVAGDRIPGAARIRQLYHDDDFRRFVSACLGFEEIYEFGDPLAQLVVNVLKPGTGHGWHFDSNEFIVTLLTQPPDDGGSFDYCPQIRRPGNENYDDVSAVLEGDESQVKSLDLRAGDLQIFFGRYSLHRVSTIRGTRSRHTVIFAYAPEQGRVGNSEKTQQIFGRVTDIHASSANSDDGLNG